MSTTSHPPSSHAEAVLAGKVAKLAHMGGQIAEFFKAYPDEQAVPAIADHINQFWSRRMRDDFIAAFGEDPSGLPPLLRKALPRIKGAPPGH
ncbi:putative NAD-dependent formate dehydrogenase [Bosea sp. LC85]|uniref:formate dehydrogenase subunit delta n=1 Tax=Bosea sp. LC85 TaxID=1502851 RepID=UPI0004E36BF0|nr:formate dehydrogenase subunit delta [Bosea sp. LC85]KFC72744.1 putative NAD-dependent formate dehydrogenase [Bosea sp. LC85]